MKRYTVTAALPYTNGPVHIGHLAGVYIPADIFVRYLRAKGEDVIFICGSDEHGVPITLRARKEGITPQQLVDKYHSIIKKSFEEFGISFSIYHRTSDKLHHQTASDFFMTLYNKKLFTEEETEQYYDEEAQMFLADRYIIGTCPNCGNQNAYGDQCENCGTSLTPRDLINPHSQLSGKPPILKKTKHWYLPLDKIQRNWLEDWIKSHQSDWKNNVFGQCKSWLDQGLQPRAVTRDLNWGVPVPLPDAKGKVLYVWFDAPIGYISATKALFENKKENWEKYWKDKETKLIHFIGKDNIVFHCIIFPAMLKEHGGFVLPENVPANEFLNLEGDKISTSRNWAVWLNEYLEEFPDKVDELRYVLASIAPETKDSEFTWKDFQARVNNELCSILGNFINRIVVLTHKFFDGEINIDLDIPVEEIHGYPLHAINDYQYAMENYRFRDALNIVMDLVRFGNKYLSDKEPWKMFDPNSKTNDEVKIVLANCIDLTSKIAILLNPFLPNSSEKIFNLLGIQSDKRKFIKLKGLYDGKPKESITYESMISLHNIKLNKKNLILFDKIEDDVINKQIQKLHTSKMELTNKSEISEQKPNVVVKASTTFDEFNKMDIRIGTILEAERVPKTDKLLKLLVDTGIDKRTVVSGIANYYEPEQIIGQQVSILVNLEPRKIKGIESQGMILMAENANGELAFVSPTKRIDNGGTVK
jgi:methionyl-tRNA synthetase